MKFEEGLDGLEGIVTKLEEEELPLEDALGLFEKGIGLVRDLTKQLDDVERRLEVLVRTAEGELELESLEDPPGDGDPDGEDGDPDGEDGDPERGPA